MDSHCHKSGSIFRVGAVNYLNTKPLIEGLTLSDTAIKLVLDLPSRLALGLEEGRLDVALIPVAELFRHPEYQLITDACIACRGPVHSVKLFFRTRPDLVQSLALDEGSRTSVILAQVLLAEIGVTPHKLEELPIGDGLPHTQADAVLLIGDRAMSDPIESFVETWDLGARWWEMTKLPFVFAAWAARPSAVHEELSLLLAAARDRGTSSLRAIAERESIELGLSCDLCQRYFEEHLMFTLTTAAKQGLAEFGRRAGQLNLLPRTQPAWTVLDDCPLQ